MSAEQSCQWQHIPGSSHLQMMSDLTGPNHHSLGCVTSFQDVVPSNAELAVNVLLLLLPLLGTASHNLRQSQLCTGQQSRLSRQETHLKVTSPPPKGRDFGGRPRNTLNTHKAFSDRRSEMKERCFFPAKMW